MDKKRIAVVQNDARRFDKEVEESLLAIADWYEFETDIEDLKEHYEVVLELR